VRLADRLEEGITTTFAAEASTAASARVLGVVLVALVVLSLRFVARGEQRLAAASTATACALILLTAIGGLGFVPGAWVALPAAAAGLFALGRAGTLRWVAVAALAAYPLTWAFQFLGGSLPQWGGRYVLAPTLVLATCGLAAAPRSRGAIAVLAVPSLVVSLLGVAWLYERSHSVEDTFEELVARPEDVVVTSNSFFAREGMAAYVERRWLAPSPDVSIDEVAQLVSDAGLESFALVGTDAQPEERAGAFRLTGTDEIPFLGFELLVHRYQR